jgi:hypothetical protein
MVANHGQSEGKVMRLEKDKEDDISNSSSV